MGTKAVPDRWQMPDSLVETRSFPDRYHFVVSLARPVALIAFLVIPKDRTTVKGATWGGGVVEVPKRLRDTKTRRTTPATHDAFELGGVVVARGTSDAKRSQQDRSFNDGDVGDDVATSSSSSSDPDDATALRCP